MRGMKLIERRYGKEESEGGSELLLSRTHKKTQEVIP